jgi:uncharacterized protein involved in tolerance to divalent cations
MKDKELSIQYWKNNYIEEKKNLIKLEGEVIRVLRNQIEELHEYNLPEIESELSKLYMYVMEKRYKEKGDKID